MPKLSKLAIDGGQPAVPPNAHKSWPEVTAADLQVLTPLLSGELWGIHGPQVTALENEFAEFCGVRYCTALSTGTAAVQTTLVAAGVQRGDEVIVAAYGYIASVAAIALRGATPVFCDIDPRTFTLDVAKIRKLITERTSAIMVVHIHGLVVDMHALEQLAAELRLALIADAPQAAGATEHGRMAGTFGVCTAFSLNGQKILPGLEGGLLTTDDPDVFQAAERFA